MTRSRAAWFVGLVALGCDRRPPARPLRAVDAEAVGLVPGQVPPPVQEGVMDDAERIPVGTSPTLGAPDALVTVVEFGDLQCPFTARARATMDELRARYGRDVRLVWKHNPLSFHPHAMLASEAAAEAYAQASSAGFWAMQAALLNDPLHLERADLERLAAAQRLDLPRFRAALDGHLHQRRIQEDIDLAQRIGASATPTFFINGAQVTGAQALEQFVAAVDQALAEARRVVPRQRAYAQMVARGGAARGAAQTPIE